MGSDKPFGILVEGRGEGHRLPKSPELPKIGN
jgi:hypothetical protein